MSGICKPEMQCSCNAEVHMEYITIRQNNNFVFSARQLKPICVLSGARGKGVEIRT